MIRNVTSIFRVLLLAAAALRQDAPPPAAVSRPALAAPLRTLRFDHGGDARPAGLTLTSAVPFAPGELPDVNELTADAPMHATALERHGDGSVRWARLQILPRWKAKKGATVELARGGAREPMPAASWNEPPAFSLVLTDPDGVERRAQISKFEIVESTPLRQVLRADAAHVLDAAASAPAGGPPRARAFLSATILAERFPGQDFFNITVVLRNDAPPPLITKPPGPVRFLAYRLEFTNPPAGLRAGVAWARENGCAAGENPAGAPFIQFFPKDTKNLWLGDGQSKMWRLCVDASGDAARFRTLLHLLEHPFLPGLTPQEYIQSRAFGDFGDMVLGPPPSAAAKAALDEADRAKRTREFGWNGPWGDVKDTHQTGSPRNGLCSDGVLRSLQTGFREWFDLTWQKCSQNALRPLVRHVRAADHPDLLLFEGVPHPKFKDRLGREGGFDPAFAKFREGTSGGYRQETHGWNGFDHEHFTVDDLYALYLMTGDPWLRFELEATGEALLTYEFAKKPATTHSARGDGWVLRGFCNLYKSLGDRRFLDAAQKLVEGMDAERSKGEMKYLHENSPDPRHLADHPFEMPWQVAIAIHGLALYHDITKNELAKNIALDLADFLVKDAWNPEASTFKRAVATDGSGAFVNETDKTGTQSWIGPALHSAWRIQPKPEYMILADGIYRNVKAANATFERGGVQWTWWQRYLRFIYDRDRNTGR